MEKTPLIAAISVGNPYDLLRYTVKLGSTRSIYILM